MKTFAKTLLAAAAAVAGTTTAQAGFREDVAPRTSGFCATPAVNCPGGVCEFGECPDGLCPAGGCSTGECGLGSCADGACGVGTGYGAYGAAGRADFGRPPEPRTAGTGYAVPTANPYYAGYRPNAACPGGVCPRTPAAGYGVGYRQPLPAANCANGACRPMPAPQYPRAQAPRFNFLGLTW